MADIMLTTTDNPWNPFTNFDEWNVFDQTAGYHTLSLLARVAITSDDESDYDQELEISRAINEIVSENISGVHTIVENK